eukprot:6181167-Pleurochrysis_carterae.AAC.2
MKKQLQETNAETGAWIGKTEKIQMEEDAVYQGVIEDLNLVASITEDYTFKQAQTQIDNILVPNELLHTLQTAFTATRVREKDHKMIVARLAWEVAVVKGECRPTRRQINGFQEYHWNKYEQILTERIQEIRATIADKRPSDKLKELQSALTRAAAEAAGENVRKYHKVNMEEEDKHSRREEKELNRGERIWERHRDQLFKWNRHLYHAQRYTGAKEKPGGPGDGKRYTRTTY